MAKTKQIKSFPPSHPNAGKAEERKTGSVGPSQRSEATGHSGLLLFVPNRLDHLYYLLPALNKHFHTALISKKKTSAVFKIDMVTIMDTLFIFCGFDTFVIFHPITYTAFSYTTILNLNLPYDKFLFNSY